MMGLISFTSSQMSKIPKAECLDKPASKNIKNIYVHKINSLIKISRDSLAVEEVEMLTQNKMGQKKIKKAYSQSTCIINSVDKTALKLEKNRQSARKARQRKNLYIKLLQNQVFSLRKQLNDSESVEISSNKYLSLIKNASKQTTMHRQNSTVEQELDRYLSHENLAALDQSMEKNQKKIGRIEQVVQEFKYWFVPEIFKGIKNLKKDERNELNNKIFKNTVLEFEKDSKICKSKDQHSLRLLLPFEQSNPELKVSNMMKSLNKNMQEIEQNLDKLTEISKKVEELIKNQDVSQLSLTQNAKSRIKYIINQMGICGVGDKPQKILQRSLRWEEFPTANILMTMQKIVQFDQFISSAILASDEIKVQRQESQIEQQREESNMDD